MATKTKKAVVKKTVVTKQSVPEATWGCVTIRKVESRSVSFNAAALERLALMARESEKGFITLFPKLSENKKVVRYLVKVK